LKLDAEEAGSLIRALVEPVQRLAMLLAERAGDPHDRDGVGASGIRQQLTAHDRWG
jgi:hypothetical protein